MSEEKLDGIIIASGEVINVGDWIAYRGRFDGEYAGKVKAICDTYKTDGKVTIPTDKKTLVLDSNITISLDYVIGKVLVGKVNIMDGQEFDEKGKPVDKVNHPKHYTYGKYEVIDVLEDWGLDKEFCLGNTIKYIARAKHKGNELEDLRKAQWYLNRKIKQLSDEVISGKEK